MNNWSIFSKYRNQIFGLASLCIMIYHFTKDIETYAIHESWATFSTIYQTWIGACGVEWFLFLSGMGLFFSFHKNPNILSFFKRRIHRLFLPYILIGVTYWILYDLVLNHSSLSTFISDVCFVTIFTPTHHIQFWYVCFVIVAYCMYPLLFSLCNGKHTSCKLWIGFSCILSGIYVLSQYNYYMYYHTHIFFTRFMIFYIGCLCAHKIYQKESISSFDSILFTLGIPLKILYEALPLENSPIIYRFVECFWALSLLYLIIYCMDHLKTSSFLIFCGKWSLEIYMLHISYRSLFKIFIYDKIRIPFVEGYALVIVCTFLSIPIYKEIQTQLFNICQKGKMYLSNYLRYIQKLLNPISY